MKKSEIVAELNAMIERRAHLLRIHGDGIEMVFDNGYVHDCGQHVENSIYFRVGVPPVREGNVIPFRRFKV